MAKIAINGFGRIGRATFRSIFNRQLQEDIEIAAINDLTNIEMLAHLLKKDSVYGDFLFDVEHTKDSLIVHGKEIKVISEKDPSKLPWENLGVQTVIESTGRFTDREGAKKHLDAGAEKVIISANSKNADFNIVLGVNDNQLDLSKHTIVSNCSCTTNCAAPVIKVLDNNFTVNSAHLITVHAVTSTQNLVDGPSKNLRRTRAAFRASIPQPTGAAVAVTKVIPELEGKLSGMAVRVPVLCGSVVEFVVNVEKETTAEEVTGALEQAAAGAMESVITVDSSDSLVSLDIVGNSSSAVVDLPLTEVLEGNLVKVVAWYDNEYGYASRLADLVGLINE